MDTEELERRVAELERTVELLSRVLANHYHRGNERAPAFVPVRVRSRMGSDTICHPIAEVMARPDAADVPSADAGHRLASGDGPPPVSRTPG